MLDEPTERAAEGPGPSPASPGLTRFNACRWRAVPHDGVAPHCTHRDVLPLAGTTGFNPDAWCPDCVYYKLRRTPKKREPDEYRY